MSESLALAEGVDLRGPFRPGYETILTREALDFVAALTRRFASRRDELLDRRRARQREIDGGATPDFAESDIRDGPWRVAPAPADLRDRRVEVTGPVDRETIIHALNSGAMVFMADFEDANAPTWRNCVEGQIHLKEAVRRTIEFEAPDGNHYWLEDDVATLMVRPRGWHLDERHLVVDGRPVPAALFDFGLFLFHNARELVAPGSGPYFHLPKLESHLEARLWNDVFVFAQREVGLLRGTIKATVSIEHVLAAFEMDEILFELREHSAGLTCGRGDYLFSFIKTFRDRVLPGRVSTTAHFLRSLGLLLIETCHKRGAHAMGGMAAGNEAWEREVGDGHDGTRVAHPDLVPDAMEVFDRRMKRPHQLHRRRFDAAIAAEDLLRVPEGDPDPETGISLALRYLQSWLGGRGRVHIAGRWENLAAAEVARAQLWQWIRHGRVTGERVREGIDAQTETLRAESGEGDEAERLDLAASLLKDIATSGELKEFLTLPADAHLSQ